MEKLVIPAKTKFEERSLVVDGDLVLGDNSKLGYGIIARKVFVGERAKVDGDILAEEVRLDRLSVVDGNVVSKGDAYIAEFATINGKLTVFGDLEIGRNVRIKKGFEARGLITIQDPMPLIMFLIFYLMLLLRLGKLDEASKIFEEKFENPMIIPENSVIEIDRIETDKDFEVSDCKVLGNIKAKNIRISKCEVFGSLRGEKIVISSSIIHGSVEGSEVYIKDVSIVMSNVNAEKVFMEVGCSVEGSIFAKKGVLIRQKVVEYGGREGEVQEDVSKPLQGNV
ncbi:MAG: acyltransferase [Archaeoglobaceae archaeon]|nr:acyltransferase [Archaeoglobaceae archaeon]MCX8151616.1 acyltransferase [Archaeoglobaceae archaeon]MDW8013106.1 acyltransferase [Archaeoglobaceae archaeon]